MVKSANNDFPLDLAVFGGSFDPIHNGHLMMAQYILEEGYAHRLAFMPASLSPFKEGSLPVSVELRYKMVELAIEQIPQEFRSRVDLFDLELHRPPPSFTVDSLRLLRERFAGQKIGFIIGSDSLVHLDRWKAIDEIFTHHTLLVFLRAGDRRELIEKRVNELEKAFETVEPVISILHNREVDCASTTIKLEMDDPASAYVRRCLPESVLEFIFRNGLYGSSVINKSES